MSRRLTMSVLCRLNQIYVDTGRETRRLTVDQFRSSLSVCQHQWILQKRNNFFNHIAHCFRGHDVANCRKALSSSLPDDGKFAGKRKMHHWKNLVKFRPKIFMKSGDHSCQNTQWINNILTVLFFNEKVRLLRRVWDIVKKRPLKFYEFPTGLTSTQETTSHRLPHARYHIE